MSYELAWRLQIDSVKNYTMRPDVVQRVMSVVAPFSCRMQDIGRQGTPNMASRPARPVLAQEWRWRLQEAATLEQLRRALLDAEKLALQLMDGAPRNATDEQMAGWAARVPRELLPQAPRDTARTQV